MITENKAIIPSELACSNEVTYNNNVWTLPDNLIAAIQQNIPITFTCNINDVLHFIFIFGYTNTSSTSKICKGLDITTANTIGVGAPKVQIMTYIFLNNTLRYSNAVNIYP